MKNTFYMCKCRAFLLGFLPKEVIATFRETRVHLQVYFTVCKYSWFTQAEYLFVFCSKDSTLKLKQNTFQNIHFRNILFMCI